MTIRVNLNQSFVGAVHARDHRTPQCMVSGNGSTHATLGINLFAASDSPEYCGVLVNNVSCDYGNRETRDDQETTAFICFFFFFLFLRIY